MTVRRISIVNKRSNWSPNLGLARPLVDSARLDDAVKFEAAILVDRRQNAQVGVVCFYLRDLRLV